MSGESFPKRSSFPWLLCLFCFICFLVPSKATAQKPKAATPPSRPGVPSTEKILATLTEVYGVSQHEAAVRKAIAGLLPAWAGVETDPYGNLILRMGKGSPRLVFVAHMDEIGWVVREVLADGRLALDSKGGFATVYFAGRAILVRGAEGGREIPGVIELPEGYAAPDFFTTRPERPGFEWRADLGTRTKAATEALGVKVGDFVTVPKKFRKLLGRRVNGRSFDDRVGCAALVAAAWQLDPILFQHEVTFVWSTEEEIGLRGAKYYADHNTTDVVFAVDTFVSADSPLESKRFGDGRLGQGFVVRAVDNSYVAAPAHVQKILALARKHSILSQYGVTGGGNDGAVFLRHGASNLALGWPLRYSHSPAEVVDLADLEALSRIVAVAAQEW